MIAIPAVDLREGACVQLVGGSYANEAVRLDNPLEVARGWVRAGFSRMHVVDLDAATDRGDNSAIVREILAEVPAAIQVGGGVRSGDTIERLLDEGAAWVVLGTRALEEPEWLAGTASSFPGQLIVAADVRERQVVTRGWARTLSRTVLDVVEQLNDIPLGGVLVTAVHREGQLAGTDLFLMEDVADLCVHPVIAAGGISTMNDLRELADRGIAAAVIGMALYTGALDAHSVAEEFAS
ncbi:MAG TPA: 1-(5-phosphoribosyl)-5-[(5-phosphoribosylamino)methylideneamino] imidazole-4-carboxamide isomerase [Gemmatimonadaceae bacterium]|nr:1-(5-phosphoribosyl)-5-[(5-phosphoribosylamino)methylideneamino] imidazole-4-carboxamide isomerase [Gemmatimonadaceae bacterium]